MSNKEGKAMVFEKPQQPFVLQKMTMPRIKETEAIVEISYTTICSSDLHTYNGRRSSPSPCVLGHEIMGNIVELASEGVKDFSGQELKIGDRVTWSIYAHDHNDEMALKGIPQKSASLFKYGHQKLSASSTLSGGFATHCHLRAGTDIFKVPTHLQLKEAAPLNCTHATVAGAIRLAGSLKDKNVLVMGVGMLGLSACAMSKEAGARKLWAMDVNQDRLTKAPDFGSDGEINASTPLGEIESILAKQGGVDVVIETSGTPSAMENGIQLLNIGGVCIWVGAVYTQRDLAINAEKIVRNILTIKGLHNYAPKDLATAIDFLSRNNHKYPFIDLVDREFPLAQLDQAFEVASKGADYRVGVHP